MIEPIGTPIENWIFGFSMLFFGEFLCILTIWIIIRVFLLIFYTIFEIKKLIITTRK